MPAGVVEQQHDALVGTGPDLAGEGGEVRVGEQRPGHGVGLIPHRVAPSRAHESRHTAPLEAVVAEGNRALSPGRPHRAEDRLRPRRCSSVQNTSTGTPGWAVASSGKASADF